MPKVFTPPYGSNNPMVGLLFGESLLPACSDKGNAISEMAAKAKMQWIGARYLALSEDREAYPGELPDNAEFRLVPPMRASCQLRVKLRLEPRSSPRITVDPETD